MPRHLLAGAHEHRLAFMAIAAAGMGMVRRIQLGPPPCPALYPPMFNASGASSAELLVRVAVTFEGGAFGVFEVDAGGRFRQASLRLLPWLIPPCMSLVWCAQHRSGCALRGHALRSTCFV
jgi:hypothetical protein